MRTIAFCLILSLGFLVNFGQAKPKMISLDLSGQYPLKIYQDSDISVSNTFDNNLYDLTITKPPLPKEILSVSEFVTGQSFTLVFSKTGVYEICFSKKKNSTQTCLNLHVLKRIAA
jgi:hypothetical protein